MLIFEFLLLLSLLLCLLIPKNKKLIFITLIIALLMFTLHAMFEGFRWQLIPAYFVLLFILIRTLRKISTNKWSIGAGILGLTLSLLFVTLLPTVIHNKNTGQFAVGTFHFEVNDTQRQRKLPTKAWFPIENTDSLKRALWMKTYKQTGPKIAALAGMPKFIFTHIANYKPTFESHPDNAVSNSKPLILLSHGRGAIKEFNAFMAQEFSSHGYVVIAADHTGGSLLSILNDGTEIHFDPKEFGENENLNPDDKQDRVQELGKRWAADLDAILESFTKRYPEYQNRKVIVGGHSTGGGSSIQYCATREHCLGVIALDPWFEPNSDNILANGINKSLLSIFSDPFEKDFEPINHQRFETIATTMRNKNVFVKEVVIAKSGHLDYCDAALLSPYSYLFGQDKGKIKTRRVMQIINEHALTFANTLATGKNLELTKWESFPEEMEWVNVE